VDATISDSLIGRVLDGRYRVEARVARGGMATVYRALDIRLDRIVALKVMHQLYADDDQFVTRFIREAKSAAKLSHPNVVSVFDQGDDNGVVFLAMEYVHGRTLRDLLRERTRLLPQEALSILEPVLSALSAAHTAGLVHRDVKPENVLLADDGRVKVADFGLARAAANMEATSATTLIGTVAYLAPEQVIRGVADPRSDVYAAGIMLFEMLTGRPPYEGETAVSVALRHAHEDVPAPSTIVPGTPVAVDQLVTRATSRDADLRPRDATAFLAETVRVRRGLPALESDTAGATTLIPRMNQTLVVELPTADTGPVAGLPQQTWQPAWPQPAWPQPPAPPQSMRPTDDQHPPSDDDGRRQRRRGLHRRGWIALLIVVLLAAGAAGAGWWFADGRWASTPSLLNLSMASAITTAKAAGLTVKTGAPAFDEKVAKDLVLHQDPPAHQRLLRGKSVTIELSKGPERFTVPSFEASGATTLAEYQALLAAANLTASSTVPQQFNETTPLGNVISTDPLPGQQEKRDAVVTVTISAGPTPIPIVNYEGQPADQATTALTTAGFIVAPPTQDFSTKVPAGSVISQSPNSGTGKLGDTITLDVSKGPQLFKVPDVVTSNLADPATWTSITQATKELTDAGFKVKVGKRGRFGVVTSQSPKGGSMYPAGTVVTINAN
jgi:serine/threonine protein kinase/beta-lactam-binding protein with PASTA domain